MHGIEIQCNGEVTVVTSTTVAELIKELELEGQRVAVELNREVVPRTAYGSTSLNSGDVVEIVQFVGGG